jgi:uncharacterized protein (DUF2062 family)
MRKLVQNFKTKFIQIFAYGLTPYQLSLTISFGITLGLFPVIGLTSILCLIFGFIFRLNLVVIQLVNWLVSPLQILMLVPFYQLGEFFKSFFGKAEIDTVDPVNVLNESYFDYFFKLLNSQLSAISGWVFICVPFAVLVHFISLFFYKSYLRRKNL